MPRLVQFMHPGRQPAHQGPGIKPWNTGEHRRSFLVAPGTFNASVSGHSESATRLSFWGEWEAPATGIALTDGGEAHTAFAPRAVTFPGRAGLQNTDPFVFDGPFIYSCCKQVRRDGTPTYLRDLHRGDVVLFGSNVGGSFVLDTVFVVSDSVSYGIRSGPRTLTGRVAQSFVEATLKPLAYTDGNTDGEGLRGACGIEGWDDDDERASCQPLAGSSEVKYRLYWGATPEARVDGMFSFAPARPVSNPLVAFARPSVRDFVSPGMTTGFRECLVDGRKRTVKEAWTYIADLVLSAGLVLGTSFQIEADANSA
ncbi:hypothetical protein WMF27_02470 [Sorangium sp. So ce281]|uniref:hypothetical protein n=1 Tax=Sorangium sp. So ce281 TaxID=3133293 RepID=UPI003F636882